MPVLTRHQYQITYVPDDCNDYSMGQIVICYVPSPPPATVTFNDGEPCNGVIGVLYRSGQPHPPQT